MVGDHSDLFNQLSQRTLFKSVQHLRILEIHQSHGIFGSDRVFEDVSNGLREIGFEVYQFSLNEQDTEKTQQKLFIKSPKLNVFSNIFSLQIAVALFRYLKTINPDIIHFHAIDTSILGFGIPILYGKLRGAHIVKTQHDWGIICTNAKHIRKKAICNEKIGLHCWSCYDEKIYFFRDFLGKKLLRNPLLYLLVDVYTAPSNALKNDMESHGYHHVQMIPNFLSIPFSRTEEHTLPGMQLIFIGRFVKEKGIEQLIECMSIIKAEIPDTELIIVGKGTQQETSHLKELVDNINGHDFIHIYEGISDSQKMKLLKDSKVCLMPSIWKENNPLVLLEAFSSGVPVIAFKIGGLPEVIQDERALAEWKNVHELAEKTIQLLRDENLRREVIHENNLRLQDFDKVKIIHQWANLFLALKNEKISL